MEWIELYIKFKLFSITASAICGTLVFLLALIIALKDAVKKNEK